jgi:hypothetical protein
MEAFAGSDDLPILYADFLGHILFQELNTSEIRRKSSPQIP